MEARSIYSNQTVIAYSAATPCSVQTNFDRLIVVVFLFSGGSLEWTWNRQEGAIALLLLYIRLALYPLFFGYYLLNRKRLSSSNASLGVLPFLLFLFIGLCLAERIVNDFVDTWSVWKDYYYLALLPLWGLVGFDIGGDVRRTQALFYRLAVLGSLLSYVSFAMQLIGVSGESLVGPMYWPFRFIVIFSFFYFLSVAMTGLNRTRSARFWLAGSALAVFWGLYKNTMVSTVLGLAAWGVFLAVKGKTLVKKGVLSFLVLTLLSLLSVAAVNQMTENSLFSAVETIYADRWTHNVDQFEGKDPLDRLNQVSGGRYRMWEDVVKKVEERPLLGAGLGQRYEGTVVTHNGYLDLLLSFGILGATLFLSVLVIWLKRLSRAHIHNVTLLIHLVCVSYIFTILAANLFGSVWVQFFTISFYITFLGGVSYRLCAERKTC